VNHFHPKLKGLRRSDAQQVVTFDSVIKVLCHYPHPVHRLGSIACPLRIKIGLVLDACLLQVSGFSEIDSPENGSNTGPEMDIHLLFPKSRFKEQARQAYLGVGWE